MGQKINPTGFRLSVLKNWSSKWYANSKNFPQMLGEDIKVREYLKKKLANASVGRVTIERPAKNARITIYSSRPGVVIAGYDPDPKSFDHAVTRRHIEILRTATDVEGLVFPEAQLEDVFLGYYGTQAHDA